MRFSCGVNTLRSDLLALDDGGRGKQVVIGSKERKLFSVFIMQSSDVYTWVSLKNYGCFERRAWRKTDLLFGNKFQLRFRIQTINKNSPFIVIII